MPEPPLSSLPLQLTVKLVDVISACRALTCEVGAPTSMVFRHSLAGSVPLDASCASTWLVEITG